VSSDDQPLLFCHKGEMDVEQIRHFLNFLKKSNPARLTVSYGESNVL
jgi:hypothetical protein